MESLLLVRQGWWEGRLKSGGAYPGMHDPGAANAYESQTENLAPLPGRSNHRILHTISRTRSRPSTQGGLKHPFLPCTVFCMLYVVPPPLFASPF